MGFRRTVDRNVMKNWMKTNRIKEEWENFQRNKYSLGVYEDMQKANRKRK